MEAKRKPHKKWITFSVAMGISILLLLNVAVHFNPFDSGECISVALDKLPMMLANRAVLRWGEKRYEITDSELVRQLASETRCATNTDLCYGKADRWIDLYCGKVLVRSMMWETEHNAIIVYQTDLFHWVLPSAEGLGMVDPSCDLLEALDHVVSQTQSNVSLNLQ